MATDRNTAIKSEQILKHTLQQDDLSPDALVWQHPVIDKDLSSPPASPSEGDRYIIASGTWDLLDENCADISDWTDSDTVNSESTQTTFDSKSCCKFDTKIAADLNLAERSRNIR